MADHTLPPAFYPRHCTVTKVVDGDTLHIVADLGCDVAISMTIRSAGINAPDLPLRDEKDAATKFLVDWVAEHGPQFELRTLRDKKEKFGRYLADLLPLDGSVSMCNAMLEAGQAVSYWPGSVAT